MQASTNFYIHTYPKAANFVCPFYTYVYPWEPQDDEDREVLADPTQTLSGIRIYWVIKYVLLDSPGSGFQRVYY